MTSLIKKPKKKIEISINEDHIISLKDLNIDEINKKYLLSPTDKFSSTSISNSSTTPSSNRKNVFLEKNQSCNSTITTERASDGSIIASNLFTKDIVEKEVKAPIKNFSVVDESAVKKTGTKSRLTSDFLESKTKSIKKFGSDVSNLTSSLEKLGISNKEIIQTESYFKDDAGREIKMLISGTNEYIRRGVEAKCWWCRHSIPEDWHPLGLPLKFIKDKEKTEFHCEGIFCSFNCMMAHLHSCDLESIKYRNCGQFITAMYRQAFGRACWTEKLIPAPSWSHLREYGGKLTIEEFRNTFNKLQIVERLTMIDPMPLYSLRTLNLVEKS